MNFAEKRADAFVVTRPTESASLDHEGTYSRARAVSRRDNSETRCYTLLRPFKRCNSGRACFRHRRGWARGYPLVKFRAKRTKLRVVTRASSGDALSLLLTLGITEIRAAMKRAKSARTRKFLIVTDRARARAHVYYVHTQLLRFLSQCILIPGFRPI